MKSNPNRINHQHWELSLWFAIFSPLIGIILGVLGLFVFAR